MEKNLGWMAWSLQNGRGSSKGEKGKEVEEKKSEYSVCVCVHKIVK